MIRRAFAACYLAGYLNQAIRFASLAVLARLLAPSDYGAFASAFALYAIAEATAECGVRSYLIQAPDVEGESVRHAFTVTLAMTLTVLVVIILGSSAPPAAIINPEIRRCLQILALALPIVPFEQTVTGHMQREMRFATLAQIQVASTAVSVAVSIALAVLGIGTISLAYGAVAGKAASLAGLLIGYRRRICLVPVLRPDRSVVQFSAQFTGTAVLSRAGENVVLILVSSLLGVAAAGIFDRSLRLCRLFETVTVNAARPIVLSHLSAMQRNKEPVATVYSRYKLPMLTAVAFPFFAILSLYADTVVIVVLGQDWAAAIGVTRVLCLWGASSSFLLMNLQFYTALGLISVFLKRTAVLLLSRSVLIAAGCLYGLIGVAAAMVVQSGVNFALTYPPLKKAMQLSTIALLRELARAGIVTAASVTAACLIGLAWQWPTGSNPLPVLPALLAAFAAWLLALVATRHPLAAEARRLSRVWRSRVH